MIELVVVAPVFQQLAVIAALDDFAVLQHDDLIGVLNCRKSVRHDEHCADVADFFKRLLNEHFRFRIDICRCFVKNENLRLVQHRSCKGQELTLTLREVFAALDDFFVKPVFELVDERIRAHVLARVCHFFLSERIVVERDVALDRAAEKEHILQHLPYRLAQRVDGDCGDVPVVNENLTFLYIVIAHDKAENCGLARARCADERACLFGLNDKGHVFQNPIFALVGKPHVAELDFAFETVNIHRAFPVANVRLDVQQIEQSLGCRECFLQVVVNYAGRFPKTQFEIHDTLDAISHATCGMAIDIGAKVITVCSITGRTARLISRFRGPTDIIGLTTNERAYRKLALSWGITPVMSEVYESTDVLFYHALQVSRKVMQLEKGDKVIITGGIINGRSGNTNTIKVEYA